VCIGDDNGSPIIIKDNPIKGKQKQIRGR